MKRGIISLFVFILLLTFSSSYSQPDEADIRKVLVEQVEAWNTGSVENFMKGYWQNDSLLFIGKAGVTYGWQKTMDNYKKNYPDNSAMGNLTFNLSEFKPLSPEYYFVVGKWHLQRTAGDIGGHFSLLFRKINGMWLIVADHSS